MTPSPGTQGPHPPKEYRFEGAHTPPSPPLPSLRSDPSGFQARYPATSYACTTSVRPPLRFDEAVHQAALKQSDILATAGCPFQHDTCAS
jgi:hypothetical protein